MLPFDFQFMAEENLHHSPATALLGLVTRLNELANHGDFDGPDQIRQENKAVLQNCQSMNALALVIIGNLTRHLPDALLYLLSRNDDLGLAGLCCRAHARVWLQTFIGNALRNWGISNQNSICIFGLEVTPDPESAHPHNLTSARDDRPQLLLSSRNMPVLQQFLQL